MEIQDNQLSNLAQSIQSLNAQLASRATAMAPRASLSAQEKFLLATRFTLVERLIRTHPEEVRSILLDPAQSSALIAADPAASTLLEQDGALSGELIETVADDFEHRTAIHHYQLHTVTSDIELYPTHSLALQPFLHQRVVVSGIASPSVMALESVRSALVPGDQQAPQANAVTSADASPLACTTLGNQNTVVLLLNFAGSTLALPTGLDAAPYWQQAVAGSSRPSVTTFWNETSYGQTSATVDVFGPLTLPQLYDCNTTGNMATAAIQAAAGTVDFSKYTRVVLVYPAASCSFGGLANVGCAGATTAINHPYSIAWIPVLPAYTTTYPNLSGDLTHEMGHNLGLNHANTLDFGPISLGPLDFQATNPGTVGGTGSTTASGPVTAINTEYGDEFSTMGGDAFGASGPYSAVHRTNILKWIPSTDSRNVTTGGTFTLAPAENSSGLRSLHILRDPISSSWLWLEYHQSTAPYEAANLDSNAGNNMTQGAMIHYQDGFGDPLHTYLLDMTPAAQSNNFLDGALLPGKSWSDPYSLLDITTNTATASALNVTATYEAPCATVALSTSAIPAAGGSGTVTITAPSTCSWTVSSNATWMTVNGTATGSGNGSVAYTAAANTTQDQRITYMTAQRQSLAVVQDGSTVNLINIAPNNSSATVGASTVFTLLLDDAAGFSDLTQVNLNVGPSLCQVAVVFSGTTPYFYLYLPASNTFTSSLLSGSAGSISSPACTLTGSGSGLTVLGNAATLTFNLSFTSASGGPQPLTGSAYAKIHNSATIPLGTFTVTQGAVLTPQSGHPGNSVPVTVTGTATHFDQTSALTFDSADITSSSTVPVNATTLTTTLKVGALAALGTHTVTVTTGDEVVTGLFIVNPRFATKTSIGSDVNPQELGRNVTFTASVQATMGSDVPTGTVAFAIDGTPAASVALDGTGLGTYTTNTLSLGSHGIIATYSGDINLLPGSSDALTESIQTIVATATPIISPVAGTYASSQTVAMTDTTPGSVIYYTINGTTPTTSSAVYSGPFTISSTTTIKAIALATSYNLSAIATAAYTINTPGAYSLRFVPVTPCRIADTRNATGAFGGPIIAGGVAREFDIPQSACGIPATALAYSLNVTVVPPGALGFLTMWPTGLAQPNSSTLNSDGRVKANAAIILAGDRGGVNVYVSSDSHVILDINGYFVAAGSTATTLAFYPVNPCRIADTRNATGSLGGPFIAAQGSRAFPVQSSSCGIPSTAQAYSLNVTAVPRGTVLNYITSWPTGQSQPNVSTLNASTGAVTANAAIVPAGTSGNVSFYASDATDLVLDINGYFAPLVSGGLSLYAANPCRVLDTRSSSGVFNGTLVIPVAISSCAPPSNATAYVLNATIVPPGPIGYLSLWPDSQAQPLVSTLNANDGVITSNLAIVPVVNGKVDAFTSSPDQLILDISSYFAP